MSCLRFAFHEETEAQRVSWVKMWGLRLSVLEALPWYFLLPGPSVSISLSVSLLLPWSERATTPLPWAGVSYRTHTLVPRQTLCVRIREMQARRTWGTCMFVCEPRSLENLMFCRYHGSYSVVSRHLERPSEHSHQKQSEKAMETWPNSKTPLFVLFPE